MASFLAITEAATGDDIATAKAVKAMRVIAPFDSAQGAMTLIALATAILVLKVDRLATTKESIFLENRLL